MHAYRESASALGRRHEVVLMRELLIAETWQEAVARYADGLLAECCCCFANDAFNPEYETWMRDVRGPRPLEGVTREGARDPGLA